MADFPQGYTQLLAGQYFQFCEITPDIIRTQVTILSVPIADDKGVLGDLWVFNYRDYVFNSSEIRLVHQVASSCAIALRQARLFQTTQAQVEELKKLNALQVDFLYTISHELRTTLSNMNTAIQLLQIAPNKERQQGYLNILKSECDREVVMINDLLDLHRLEAVSAPMALETVDLLEWLPRIIEPFHSRCQACQQTLHVELPLSLPEMLSDRACLERLLTELLNNACKYTLAGGKISLSVHQEFVPLAGDGPTRAIGSPNSTPVIVFTIKNQAEISLTELPHIFEKFYRGANTKHGKQEGTGLGLAIVQKLVEQMLGSIQVDSSGGWTTFTLQFPTRYC